MITVDVRGKLCPMPLIETKKALKESGGETIRILTDNETSVNNVMHYLEDNGIRAQSKKMGDEHEIIISEGQTAQLSEETAPYCRPEKKEASRYVVVVSKERMGEGPIDLGQVLAGSLLNTLNSMDPLPWRMVFYNSGVLLALKDSYLLPLFESLANKGVEMIACTTCLNYYEKMDDLALGRPSGMPEIVDTLLRADRVIYF